MFENRKIKAVQRNTSVPSSFLRNGLLAIAVASVAGGCAQIPHGSMFSDDRQVQMQSSAQPSLAISRDIDLVRVTGTVGSKAEAAMIRLRVATIYGAELVIDDLQIDESLGSADWYNAVLDTADSMQDVEKFGLLVDRGELRLEGVMQSKASAEALANDAATALGQQLIVMNEFDYPGRDAEVLALQAEQVEETANEDTLLPAQQTESDQQLTAQSIPSPAVSSTIALPATNSAVVVKQRDSEPAIFVPPADLGIVRSAKAGTIDDSDGDGIANSIDECNSRPGYPVNAKGCQALDGMLKNVRFQGDGSTLTREAMASLDNVARVMSQYPASRIAILSYTSNNGSALENRGQSRERARSVVGYLINKGVQGTRLEAYAFGHINNSDDHIMIKEVD